MPNWCVSSFTLRGPSIAIEIALSSGPRLWSLDGSMGPGHHHSAGVKSGVTPSEVEESDPVWTTVQNPHCGCSLPTCTSHNFDSTTQDRKSLFDLELQEKPWRDEIADLRKQSVVCADLHASTGGKPIQGPIDANGVLPMLPKPKQHWMVRNVLDFVGDDLKVEATLRFTSKWSPVWKDAEIRRSAQYFPDLEIIYRYGEQGNGFVGKFVAAGGMITESLQRGVSNLDFNPDFMEDCDYSTNTINPFRGEFADVLAMSG
jgi:hypothetical protein